MANLNKVFLIGRLTRDPELKYTPGGSAVTDLGIATNRRYTTRDGESREETVFLDVTVWGRQAETSCQYLKKGRQVHVEGFLKMETWEDKTTGQQRSKIKIQADNVQFLDSLGGRRDDHEDSGPADDEAPATRGSSARPTSPAPSNGEGSVAPAPRAGGMTGRRAPAPEPEENEEDIPF